MELTTVKQFKVISDSKEDLTLEQAQTFCEGSVQVITFERWGGVMIMNEEGKMRDLPLNPEATTKWRAHFTEEHFLNGQDDYVAGPAIWIKKQAIKAINRWK